MQTYGIFAVVLTLGMFSLVGTACAEDGPQAQKAEKYAWEKNLEGNPSLQYYRSVTGGEKYKHTFERTFAPAAAPSQKK